jgi:catechol 2,3-dioxygenase-like lactoylglutathione lyase family enzyme
MGAAIEGRSEAAGAAGGPNRWRGIDHVQLAIPVGGEDAAREFYVDVLGFAEVPKPPALAVRGGAWFEAGDTAIHVGVEPDFVPARKAHPALLVAGLTDFVAATGLDVRWSDEIPGTTRCHVDDPFGNRLELIEAAG